MKNKLLISLLLIVSSYSTYLLFFKSPEISNNSYKNSSALSDNTHTSPTTIQQSPKNKESTSTLEEINYNSSNSSSALSDNTHTSPITIPQSHKNKESTSTLEEINYNSSNNSSALSDDTQTSSTTIEKSPKIKENTSLAVDSNISNTAKLNTKTITISNFLSSLKCTNYVLKSGETLTQIARKYETTCNLNTSIKLIKSINKINDGDNLNSGVMLSIPESILTTGTMHTVTTGDTWYSIAKKHYNAYDVDSITKLLVYINDLPNNDLPLGESIFLPSI